MIKSVRLINFGAIREAYFKPLESGITGIFGSNGAGKSTILTGVLFALFGVTPKNVTVGSLRRTGTEKEECSVSVLFTNAGQEIEVIKEVTGSKNTVKARLFVDGIEQTVDSVRAADVWIKDRLGVDAKGFTTAFVVRQKELDELVSDVPSKRKETIEKLAGIDTLKDALQNARKDENVGKEVLKTVAGSVEDIERAEGEFQLIVREIENYEKLAAEREQVGEDLLKRFNSVKDELTELHAKKTSLDQLNNQIHSQKQNINILESSIKSVEYVVNSKEDYDLENLREVFNKTKAELNEKRQQHGALQVEIASGRNKVSYVQERLASAPALDARYENEDPAVWQAKAEALFTEGQELSKKKHELEARSNDVKESILQLSHSSECPTCYTPLDELGDLTSRLEKMVEEFDAESNVIVTRLDQNKEEQASANVMLSASKEYAHVSTARAALEAELAEAFAAQVDDSQLKELETSITELTALVEKQTEAGIKARTFIDDKAKYDELSPKLRQSAQALAELEIQAVEVNASLDYERARKLSESFPGLETAVRLNHAERDDIAVQQNSLNTRYALAESRLKSVTAQWDRKKELLLAQERKALTRDMIDQYRQQTIASLTPELSDYASALISDITDGAYESIRVDEDFNITVLNRKGIERKASELSGGEESAVALSLRLAIGSLITGGNQDLLWLDEILTAQDADRRASMLATIRDLSIKQIIMINHTAEAADIADRTVTVVPDLDKGSTLENADRPLLDSDDPLDALADDDDF